MRVFISYAHEDRELAERIRGTLAAAGFDCFLDRHSLPPGQEYGVRIGQAIARADLFVFVLSAPALEPGSYALTELSFAERKWPNPAGYVLPVAPVNREVGTLPAYLRPINVFQAQGNTEAEILAWVQERATRGGGGGEETPRQRLDRWTRLHQPPLRRARKLPLRQFASVLVGLAFIGFGVLGSSLSSEALGSSGFAFAFAAIPIAVCCSLIILALVRSAQGLLGAKPAAALVLDRSEHRGVTVHLLLANDTRKSCSAVGRNAMRAYPGEIGWAFVTGGMLIDFESGPQTRLQVGGDPNAGRDS
jgi:hypothetical protein